MQFYENTANEDKLRNTGAAEDALMEIELPKMLSLPSCVTDIRRTGQLQPTHQTAGGGGAEATGEMDRAVGDKATRPVANQSKEGATTAPGQGAGVASTANNANPGQTTGTHCWNSPGRVRT